MTHLNFNFRFVFLFFILINIGFVNLSNAKEEKIQPTLLQKKIAGQARVVVFKEQIHALKVVQEFYKQNDYHLVWQKPNVSSALVRAIVGSYDEGLNPQDYHLEKILLLKENLSKKKSEFELENIKTDLDLLLSDSFYLLASHFLNGRSHPFKKTPLKFNADESLDWVNFLNTALKSKKIEKALYSLLPADSEYMALKGFLENYRTKIKKNKNWTVVPQAKAKIEIGDKDFSITKLRKRLAFEGYINPKDNSREFDDKLQEAVKEYQIRNGLEPDGQIGQHTLKVLNVPLSERICQMEVNLDRYRSKFKNKEKRQIQVNVPAFYLNVIENEKSVLDMRVIVGRLDRKTPLFSHEMKYVNFFPFWHVPKKIAIEDKLPEIIKDPTFIEKMGMKVYDVSGEEKQLVDPATVDWSLVTKENFNYHIVQNPGFGNALGTVKFMFPNEHDVYIHDTPDDYLFQRDVRTFSSGCIRISSPDKLAKYVLKNHENWNDSKIDTALKSGERQTVYLKKPIPVDIRYQTAWVDNQGRLQLRYDIYNIDKQIGQSLCRPLNSKEVKKRIALTDITR